MGGREGVGGKGVWEEREGVGGKGCGREGVWEEGRV